MCVLEFAPGALKSRDIDFCVRKLGGGPRPFLDILPGILIGRAKSPDQFLERVPVDRVLKIDLVDGVSRRVEELKTQPFAIRREIGHGKTQPPCTHEEPQVDIGSHHLPHAGEEFNLPKLSITLMHGMLIAGEAHDPAQTGKFRDKLRPVAFQAGDMACAIGGKQLRLANPQQARRITDAKFRLFFEQPFPPFLERSRLLGLHSVCPLPGEF